MRPSLDISRSGSRSFSKVLGVVVLAMLAGPALRMKIKK